MASDANWWEFSLRVEERGTKILDAGRGLREVNPVLEDGRRKGSYYTYLELDGLLSCQVPSSRTPDERVFVIGHQLFELAFKQFVFDLAVISNTFDLLISLADRGNSREFLRLCCTNEDATFWCPASTASARLVHATKVVLPGLFGYFRADSAETFSSREFYRFRPYLTPASGFQSAQFRLIQSALGKQNVFRISVFPGDDYKWHYDGQRDARLVPVTDPALLSGRDVVVEPRSDSPLADVAALNKRAHALLDRISDRTHARPSRSELPLISTDDVDAAVDHFRQNLIKQARTVDAVMLKQFEYSLQEARNLENELRKDLAGALSGADYLRSVAPEGFLIQVLQRVVQADHTLHGPQDSSFLSHHFRVAAKRVADVRAIATQLGEPEPPAGTGGGGTYYLTTMWQRVIPLFPAIVALREAPETDQILGWV